METPLELINNRLKEIAVMYKNAYNNDMSEKDLQPLADHYNQYYFALQLLGVHSTIPTKFFKMINVKGGGIRYRETDIKKHLKHQEFEQKNVKTIQELENNL